MTTTRASSIETPAPAAAPAITSALADCELIARFALDRDERAFAELVTRHGSLVMSVSRRVLRQAEDQEDVFQATFLALAREAGRVRWQTSLAGWLYKVAYRSALRVRAQRAARKEQPVEDASMIPDEQLDDLAEIDAQQRLFEELAELPAAYRDAILVCCLEGQEREQAAAQLGCSELALKGRLQRGRQMLLRRLTAQGLGVAAVLAVAQQSVQAASASVTPELVADTTQAAIAWASGKVALSAVLSNPTAYPQGAWITMMQTSAFKGLMICAFSLVALWGGMSLVSGSGTGANPLAGSRFETSGDEHPSLETPILALAQGDIEAEKKAAASKAELQKAPAAKTPEQAAATIRKALDRPSRWEFIETPLADIIEFLKDENEIPIQLDKTSLELEGIDTNTPVTMNVAGVSLRAGLRLMLEPLKLKHVIKNEVLVVTTKEKASEEVNARPYRVRDLLGDADGPTLEGLVEVIRTTIAPTTWESPSRGQIKPLGKTMLVILQTDDVHDEIEKLLKSLREDE